MIVIFLGPPGAGKGTYSELLSERLKIPHISTGDILRDAIEKKTHLGKLASELIDRGELVPDDIMMGLLAERITRFDAHKGFILDGFPRTRQQSEKLDELLGVLLRSITYIVNLELTDQKIVDRLTKRRVCTNCGAIYHLVKNPPKIENVCDICGGKVIQRPDDVEETIRHRISLYRDKIKPVMDYYSIHDGFITVSGDQNSTAEIEDLFEELGL